MLAFVLETFKDLLIIEESLDGLGLIASQEAVRVPDIGDPGVEQNPPGALRLPVGEEDLTEHLGTQSSTPTHSQYKIMTPHRRPYRQCITPSRGFHCIIISLGKDA